MSQELDLVNRGIIKQVTSLLVTADADITQVITVTTAGTSVQGPDKDNPGGWIITGNPANTKPIYYMFHGQTKTAKGFPINPGEKMIVPVLNLSNLDFDADVNGEKVHAAKV